MGAGASGGSPSPTVSAATTTVTRTVSGTGQTPPAETVTVEAPAPAAETVTVTANPAEPATGADTESGFSGDGTYEVGVDIQPGTYISPTPDSGNCYWARRTSSDSFDGIIDNDNSSGQSVVTIKKSDKFFETSGCNDWTPRS